MILTAGRLWDEAKNTAALAQVAPRLPWPVYVAGEQQHPSYGSIAAFDHAVLDTLQQQYGAPRARPLYCAVDPDLYFPEAAAPHQHDLGYMGTYSADRQPRLETLLLEPARRWPAGKFIVAGPQYPANVVWPPNVERMMHLSPAQHRPFYTTQRFTLNITRADMIQAGYSPGVRLFEAAACGTPIISDYWEALEIFFDLDTEICVAHSTAEVLHVLHALPEDERQAMGMRARQRVLAAHTAAHRAAELEGYVAECWQTGSTRPPGNGYRSHAAARAAPERSV
jgi:spore maturation protein CgeB